VSACAPLRAVRFCRYIALFSFQRARRSQPGTPASRCRSGFPSHRAFTLPYLPQRSSRRRLFSGRARAAADLTVRLGTSGPGVLTLPRRTLPRKPQRELYSRARVPAGRSLPPVRCTGVYCTPFPPIRKPEPVLFGTTPSPALRSDAGRQGTAGRAGPVRHASGGAGRGAALRHGTRRRSADVAAALCTAHDGKLPPGTAGSRLLLYGGIPWALGAGARVPDSRPGCGPFSLGGYRKRRERRSPCRHG